MNKNKLIKQLFEDTEKIILNKEHRKKGCLTYDGIWIDNNICQVFLFDLENDCYYVATRNLKYNSIFIIKTGKIELYYTDKNAQIEIYEYIRKIKNFLGVGKK